MDSATTAKVLSTFIILVITLIFGSLPAFVLKCLQNRRSVESRTRTVLSYLNCFAGGVFFGTAMLHLFAESSKDVQEVLDVDYPIAELTVSGGFFLILLSEILVMKITSLTQNKSHDTHNVSRYGTVVTENQEHEVIVDDDVTPCLPGSRAEKKADIFVSSTASHDNVIISLTEKPTVLRSAVLVIAFCLHFIFESLAVGLQSEESDVWAILLAISLHKCIVAFSVGLQIRQILVSWKFLLFIVCFSLISAVGVPIGIAVSDIYDKESAVTPLLMCVATGTFFYVTFFEIIQKEFSKDHSIIKFLVCIAGFALVAVFMLFDAD